MANQQLLAALQGGGLPSAQSLLGSRRGTTTPGGPISADPNILRETYEFWAGRPGAVQPSSMGFRPTPMQQHNLWTPDFDLPPVAQAIFQNLLRGIAERGGPMGVQETEPYRAFRQAQQTAYEGRRSQMSPLLQQLNNMRTDLDLRSHFSDRMNPRGAAYQEAYNRANLNTPRADTWINIPVPELYGQRAQSQANYANARSALDQAYQTWLNRPGAPARWQG